MGTISPKSILQPIRYLTRHKERNVTVIEAEAHAVDPIAKTVTFSDDSEIQGAVSSTTIPYDYLVYGVGAETQTFGIPGVQEHACFMKEIQDGERMKRRFLDCVESAGFPGQSDEEIDRLLHFVVVGGGPTGVEVSGELHDFLEQDLKSWYPELSSRIRITLVEALPSVLPMFSKRLIDYTESTFQESKIDILTKTMVKEIKEKSVVLQMPDKTIKEVPVGMVVWAGGNKPRVVTNELIKRINSVVAESQTNRRGIAIDGTCTSYLPTLVHFSAVLSKLTSYLVFVSCWQTTFAWSEPMAPSSHSATVLHPPTPPPPKSHPNKEPTSAVSSPSSLSVMFWPLSCPRLRTRRRSRG